jgi:predicted NAD/FAD-binding protein
MNIAIIGCGISGLTAAYYLNQKHNLTLFESAAGIGGHTATVDVDWAGRRYAIDTGFIVYNDWTYPNFIELMETLEVAGNSVFLDYVLRVPYNGDSIDLRIDDRMYLVSERVLLIESIMTKWGFEVGSIMLVIEKQ